MDMYKAIDGTTIIHGKGSKVPFAACSMSIIIPTGGNVGGAIVMDYVVSKSYTRTVIINGHVSIGNILAFGGGSSGLCFGLGMDAPFASVQLPAAVTSTRSPSVVRLAVAILLVPFLTNAAASARCMMGNVPSFPLQAATTLLAIPRALALRLVVARVLFGSFSVSRSIRFPDVSGCGRSVRHFSFPSYVSVVRRKYSNCFSGRASSRRSVRPSVSGDYVRSTRRVNAVYRYHG